MKGRRGRRPATAEELARELNANPEYRAAMLEKEQERIRRAERTEKDSAPVLKELCEAGFQVDSIPQLAEGNLDYKDAIPILLRWLPLIKNRDVKQCIVSALSVECAKPVAAPVLIEEFLRIGDEEDPLLKWSLGNALEIVADDSVFDDIVRLATDQNQGKAREMLVMALGKMKNRRAADVLVGLLDDEVVAGHAIIGLRKLRAKKARAKIERFVDHPKAWVRREAKRAIAAIERATEHSRRSRTRSEE